MTTVLVVDDSPVDRRVAGRLLEKDLPCTVHYAAHGVEALRACETAVPDLVVTDLHMPEMDGLELVTHLRRLHPQVPVVLMTAQGSEEIAVRALMSGAASYVRKTDLATQLVESVMGVLEVSRADHQDQQLLACLAYEEMRFKLPNDSSLISPLVDKVQGLLMAMGLVNETDRVRVGLAVEAALLNALFHGNLEMNSADLDEASSMRVEAGRDAVLERARQEPYAGRRLHLDVAASPEEARIRIRDEGPGFDFSMLPDPADPASLSQAKGRGLVLMRMFMDEVNFHDGGREVVLVKRRSESSGDASA